MFEVNYTDDYNPSKESIQFFNWMNMMFPDSFDSLTPTVHFKMMDNALTKHRHSLSVCARDLAKSTLHTQLLPLYVGMLGTLPNFGKVNNILIISATYDQAVAQLKSLRAFFDNSPMLQEYLSYATTPTGKPVGQVQDCLVFDNLEGNRVYIQARGAGQQIRGTNKENQRPQLVIMDDILPDECLLSANARKALSIWYSSSLMYAIDSKKSKMIAVGTPMTEDDLLMSFAASGEWKVSWFPVCEEFTTSPEDIVPAWKDRQTAEVIIGWYKMAKAIGEEGSFFREKMLEITPSDTRVFQDEDFRGYLGRDFELIKHELNFFTTMDLAVAVNETSDYTAIITIGVDKNNRWYVVRVDFGRWRISETMDKLFKHFRQFNPISFRAEKASLQQVFQQQMEEKMMREQVYVDIGYLSNNSVQSKHQRIMSLSPRHKSHKILFREDGVQIGFDELNHEMKGYTVNGRTTKKVDVLDCLANFSDPNFVVSPSQISGVNFAGLAEQYQDNIIF